MARKKKVEKKKFLFANYKEMIDCYASEKHNATRGTFVEFFERIEKGNDELNDSFRDYFKQKREELDNTPLTRAQYDEAQAKLEEEKKNFSPISYHNPYFLYYAVHAFVFAKAKEYGKEELAEKAFDFVWEDMDFLSVLAYTEEDKYYYRNEDNDRYGCDPDLYPESSHFKGSFFGYKHYALSGNTLDKVLQLYFK